MAYRASHILVKHKDSRRPASWKDEEGATIKTRTKEDATAILRGFRDEINTGKRSLADIARVESDCGSAAQGGDLGLFGDGEMQKPFEDGVKALKPGQLSDVVYTDSGAHIILRTK